MYVTMEDMIRDLQDENTRLKHENVLLTQQVDALSSQNDFQEELIVELANIVYA